MKKKFLAIILVITLLQSLAVMTTVSAQSKVEEILASMTTEDKIAQMIMPAFRYSTDEEGNLTNVTEITNDISDSLSKHGFSGVILFGQNISDNAQTTRLVDQLQKANATNSSHTQLLIATDQEGGAVTRLAHGTTWMGNMSLGAINDTQVTKEVATVIGSECKALGINVDFAPVVDVNNNPANPVIGTRSFSDDPEMVSKHGTTFVNALNETGVISTLKHFPGHGDTDTDSHTGLPMVDKSYDELMQNELIPFKACIDAGSQMIMTAHIQYPQIEKDTYTSVLDGEQIYIPATLSDDIINGVLREKLGYKGVVITDAMEMDAIAKHFDKFDAAKLAIGAGVDIILMPVDTTSKAGFEEMDNYISTVAQKVDNGEISMDCVNSAVLRILTLKENNGLLDAYDDTDIEAKVDYAVNNVGTKQTHDREWELTKNAITLVKNDGNTLPLTKANQKTVVLVPYDDETTPMEYAVKKLKDDGKLPVGAVVKAYSYRNKTAEEVLPLVDGADNVVFLSEIYSTSALAGNIAAMGDAIADKIHEAGGKFVVMSVNLPYDVARYQKADAIMIAYLASSMSADPTDKTSEIPKYGPNMPVALYMMFSADDAPTAKLPINIPKLDENYKFTSEILYARGFGLTYKAVQKTVAIKICTVSGIKNKTYTGKALKQSVVVKNGSVTLKNGTDYTISYKNNKNAGKATVTIKGKGNYTGSITKTFSIKKATQPMTVTANKKTVKASKLKKAKVLVKKAITVKNNKGFVTYKKVSGSKYLTINKKGVITVKKAKYKKQTLKFKVKATAKGNANYKSGSKTITVKIKIK